jgi:dTDP-glucose 4,6-dehydratase
MHFAAQTHVDASFGNSFAFTQNNVVGTHALLEAARMSGGVRRFLHVSTDEVYGSIDEGSWPETHPLLPNSPYAASKASSDLIARSYARTHGLDVVITRCSNNYGPFQFPEKLIPLMLVNCLYGKPLPIYGDGMNIRDWLHVDDHCRGIALALERGRPGEVYNIGGENERPNLEIVQRITAAIDGAFAADPSLVSRFPASPAARGEPCWSLVTYVKDRPGHDRRYAIDPTKARAELGYRPHETFETGLAKTVAWYLANERWWRAVMDGTYRQWIERNYAAR